MDSFHDMANQLADSVALLKANLPFALALIAALYGIHLVNFLLGYRLNFLGIYPRHILGLPGIFFCPLLHGNFNHLFFNSLPLLILMSFVLLGGITTFFSVTATIVVLGGAGTWLLGRKALHIGASGLIMGYWGYLLMSAYQQPTILSLALGLVCIYYLGSLFMNLLPTEAKSSWEAHMFGFLGGIAANYTTPYLNAILHSHGS